MRIKKWNHIIAQQWFVPVGLLWQMCSRFSVKTSFWLYVHSAPPLGYYFSSPARTHTYAHTQKGLLVRLGCCSSSKSSVGRYILTTIRNGWVVSEWPPLQLPLATWERSYSYLGLARVRWQPGRFLFLTHTHPSASLESAWYERLSLRREAKEQQREECL